MKQVILLCSFGLLGSFAMANNEIIHNNETTNSSETTNSLIDTKKEDHIRACARWTVLEIYTYEDGEDVVVSTWYCAEWAI